MYCGYSGDGLQYFWQCEQQTVFMIKIYHSLYKKKYLALYISLCVCMSLYLYINLSISIYQYFCLSVWLWSFRWPVNLSIAVCHPNQYTYKFRQYTQCYCRRTLYAFFFFSRCYERRSRRGSDLGTIANWKQWPTRVRTQTRTGSGYGLTFTPELLSLYSFPPTSENAYMKKKV